MFFAKSLLTGGNVRDREAFDNLLTQGLELYLNNITPNLSGDEIYDHLESIDEGKKGFELGRVFIGGCESGDMPGRLEGFIQEFKTEDHPKKVALILPSDERAGTHWFTVIVTKNERGDVVFVIADSACKDRRENATVLRMYSRFIGTE